MEDPSQTTSSLPALVALLVLGGASVTVCLWVAVRKISGLPLVPYEPRRPVPWRLPEVLLIFAVLYLLPVLVLTVGVSSGPKAPGATGSEASGEVDVQHPIVDLLEADQSISAWLLCVLLAVVVAPFLEEFTYRLVLQGWLEAEERRARRWIAALRRLTPGVLPVVLVALFFALQHVRWAEAPKTPEQLIQLMVRSVVASFLVLAFAVTLLRSRSRATTVDLGFVGAKFLADVRLGLLAFAAVSAPILLLQFALIQYVLPDHVAADPIALIPLALVLGALYYRTHRIVPAIALHMAFNATNLFILWLEVRGRAAAAATVGLW